MEKRFTKENVSDHIQAEIERLQKKHKFNENDGWRQVEGANREKIIDFGAWNGLRELHQELFGNDKNFYL